MDGFFGAVGTAGMLVGVSRALKESGSAARASSPSSRDIAVAHHRERWSSSRGGTAAGIVPPHLKPGAYDEARAIDEEEARAMARRLAQEEGIFAGTSSGLNLVGALNLARELGPGKVVATVARATPD